MFITVSTGFVMLGHKTAKTFKTDLKLLFAAKSTPLFKQQEGFNKEKIIFSSRLSLMQ